MKAVINLWTQAIRQRLRTPRVLWRSENEVRKTTIEVRSWAPFVVFGVVLFWYVFTPAPVAMMTAVALGCLCLSAYAWAHMDAVGVSGERRLRSFAMQVGDELEEEIHLVNHTAFPVLWAEYLDRSNLPGYTVSSVRAVDAEHELTWRAHIICTRRGVFQLGPWELNFGDPFGILLVRQVYLQPQEILVYPPLAMLPEQLLWQQSAPGENRPLNQPIHAETVDSVTVRPYAPGDAFRYVHWPTTARQDELFVRVFAPQAASRVWMIPDFDSSVHWSQGEHSSLELMITVAASLAAALLQKHLSVGLFAWDEKEVVLLPHQGQAHLWPILQALAPVRGCSKLSLRDVLSQARRLVSGTDVVIVLTPAVNSDWLGELRDLSHSRSGRGRAEVILFDPGSSGPADEATEKGQDASLMAVEQAIEPLLRLIREANIPAYSLRPEDVRIIDAYYGEVSRWEFVVMGTGKAVARKKPRSTDAFLMRP